MSKKCGNEGCSVSTGICGSLTFGWGNLDDNGFWEFPCEKCDTREAVKRASARKHIKNLFGNLDMLERVERNIRTSRMKLKEEVKERLAELLYRDKDNLELGGWDCDRSPTKKCVYDTKEDRNKDFCVVCGEPDERL